MLTSVGGTCDGQATVAGSVIDLGETSARDYVNRGLAEYVVEEIRTAVVTPPRNAARHTRKPKPRKGVNQE